MGRSRWSRGGGVVESATTAGCGPGVAGAVPVRALEATSGIDLCSFATYGWPGYGPAFLLTLLTTGQLVDEKL